jgi:hypothetical protein
MAVMLESRVSDVAQVPGPALYDLDETAAQATAEVLQGPARETVVAAPLRTRERRSREWRVEFSPLTARLAGLLMLVGFVVATAVEPAANGPQPVLPFWADALATVTLVVLLGCWASLAAGRRSGLRLGVVAGSGLVAMAVSCPAVDHHVIAGWWWAQLAVSVGIVLLSAGLLAATRPGRTAGTG